ncbi:DUF2690 domain-containing protein [Streptomyces sp. enrichment culture]|uniref:helix-turn-helix domain-containing protein n=1 Tax=Streptomyces sp. enrichment culture TaxID=1795815 RepID=UPI003F575CEA
MPDELDPQIREFTSQLRRLVDRSGLSIAAVSDQTGYSRTSWERYLNGRLLAPKGAIVALAEVTGTNPVHLTTMWELAERAWSRSEMRHDMTMEAIRIAQARAALSEFGPPPAKAKGGRTARKGGSATVTPGIAGPAGVAPTVPVQPSGPDTDVRDGGPGTAVRDGGPGTAARDHGLGAGVGDAVPGVDPKDASPPVNSWNIAGYRGPAPTGGARRAGAGTAAGPARPGGPAAGGAGGALGGAAGGPAGAPGPVGAYGEPPRGPRPAPSGGKGGRRLTAILAGVVGVAAVAGAAFFLLGGGDEKNEGTDPKPSPTATSKPVLPPGVDCVGESCTGKDAEAMGCGGDLVTTAGSVTVGTTLVEVRYSEICKAAWGRITAAAPGDEVKVTAGKSTQTGSITLAGDTIAYTPMVAVKNADEAVACATLAVGTTGCTE